MMQQAPSPDTAQKPFGRAAAGHPVDIASGILFNYRSDFRLDDHVSLTWDRAYSTGLLAHPAGVLGPGWTATYLATLEQQPGKFLFCGGDGGNIEFVDDTSVLAGGGILTDFGAFASFSMEQYGVFVVTRWFPDTHDAERLVFATNADGTFRLRTIESMVGQAIDLEHDSDGRLIRAGQRREGRALTFAYNRAGRLSEVTAMPTKGSPVIVSRYAYDEMSRLVERRDAATGIERYMYDEHNRMVAERTLGDCVYRFEFDAMGRRASAIGDGGFNARKLTYHAHIGWTEVTDSTGAVWRYNWMPSGQVIRTVSPLGAVTRRQFDSLGRPVEFVDPLGARMVYRYDGRGDRTAIVNALGNETRFRYNYHHQLIALRNVAGDECHFDRPDRLLSSIKDFAGHRAYFAYNAAGDLSEVRDPNGHVTRYEHTPYGDFAAWISPRGLVTRYTYDGFGRMTGIARPDGTRFAFSYDILGRARRCTRPDGEIVEYEYEATGQITKEVRPDGRTNTYSYGSSGRLREAVGALGRTKRFKWSAKPGKLLRVEDEARTCFGIEWDADDRSVAFDSGSGLAESMQYDLGGNCVAVANAAGESTSFEYDAVRRLTCKRVPDGTEVSYGYDAMGGMTFARSQEHEVQFRRDRNGRVVEERQGDVRVASNYDWVGNRLTHNTSAGHDARFSYNPDDDLDGVSIDGRFALSISTDPQGRPLETRSDRGGRIVQEFNGLDRLTSRSIVDAAGHEVAGRTVRYDTEDRPILLEDVNAGRSVLMHDAAGHTGYVEHEDGSAETYTYDARNRLETAVLRPASAYRGAAVPYAPPGRQTAIAVFRASQAGKSYLVSGFAAPRGRPLIAAYGKERLNFLTDLNPEGGDESTGLVSRFTIRNVPGPQDAPVPLRLLSQTDVVKVLANTFLEDFQLPDMQLPGTQAVTELLQGLEPQARPAACDGLTVDDIEEMREYFENYFRGKELIRDLGAAYWTRAAELIPRLPAKARAAAYAPLWNGTQRFTALAAELIGALGRIGFADTAFCSTEALSRRGGNLLDAGTVLQLGAATGSVQVATTAGARDARSHSAHSTDRRGDRPAGRATLGLLCPYRLARLPRRTQPQGA